MIAAIAVYHLVAGYPLAIDQTEALAAASRAGRIPGGSRLGAGHLAWSSQPALWRVLVYSADDPPSLRGIVELDAVDGHLLYESSEPNPEDWSEFGLTKQ